ncbi:acyl-CoA dehydrogenase family protein [Chloroflexota bacterium]
MDFSLTSEQEQLRYDIREFLEDELKQGSFKVQEDSWMTGFSREFSRKLAGRGWIGMTYPKEYGGSGRSYLDRLIVSEELLRYGAPVRAHWTGDRQVGPGLLKYGTESQKKELLAGIISGELSFSLGFSEPDAGSDMASLKTAAIADGDVFVINGQKVWTSAAAVADYIYLLARTDPQAPKKQWGLSLLLVPVTLPGITIRPLLDIAGHYHYAEIFFDNVRLPKTALLGEEGRGWNQVGESLAYERAGIERLMTNYPLYENLFKYVKETNINGSRLSKVPWIRSTLADLTMKFEVAYNLLYRATWMLDRIPETGYIPNWETAMTKAFSNDFEQELANVATKIAGLYGGLAEGCKWAPFGGMIGRSYLFSPGYSLQGGTPEILRGIVATAGLGLPRR